MTRQNLSLKALCCVFGLLGSAAQAQTQADPEAASGFAPKPVVSAERYMIAAANPHAARAGEKILAEGGSAVDAAIAAQLALNVVEPQSSGIGGGAFALLWQAQSGALTSWDGRETAPAAATPEMFLGPDGAPMKFREAVASGLGVGAPGLLAMLSELHQRHGALPWARLFDDAIFLAREGFEVSPRLAKLLKSNGAHMLNDAAAKELFFKPSGEPLEAGDLLRNPDLAETLSQIAQQGADAFYNGPIAEAVVAAAQRAPRGGGLAAADLAAYTPLPRPPVCAPYRARYIVCGMGPPSSGGVGVAQILSFMAHFPRYDPSSPASRHAFLEASRLAYADRAAYLADADSVSVPVRGLLDPYYITSRTQQIDRAKASAEQAQPGNPPWQDPWRTPWREGRAPDLSPERPATTHISVVDAQGNVFSMTSSIESAFGSGRMAAGVLLNNQLTDFSFRPSKDGLPIANAAAPGKRPRSSMSPTIVFEATHSPEGLKRGKPVLVIGSPGGSRIIEYVAGATLAVLDARLNPAEAAALPHASHRNRGASVERRSDADMLASALESLGHEVGRAAMTSGLHIIQITPDGQLWGGADPRREGEARGE